MSSQKRPGRPALSRPQIIEVGRKATAKTSKTSVRKRQQKTIENNETCLHKHAQQWLEKSGLWSQLLIFHVPNERKGGIGAIMHFRRMGVRKGVADYLAFVSDRRSIAIELKDDEGTQDEDQIKFQRKWEACGNVYIIVRTLEEFKGAIDAIRIFS